MTDWATSVTTPAFVFDASECRRLACACKQFADACDAKINYSTKALSIRDAIMLLAPWVNGFSVSSIFEARIVRETVGAFVDIDHISPMLSDEYALEVADLCSRVTLNSIAQVDRFARLLSRDCAIGIRVKPPLSFVEDPRYDPCRNGSRLGVPIDQLAYEMRSSSTRMSGVSGLHLHINCDSFYLEELRFTAECVVEQLGDVLSRFEWLNLGGGYLFANTGVDKVVAGAIREIAARYGVEIRLEPGAAMVRSAGVLISTVGDIVRVSDRDVAILDTSVNHWPEVFEYQFEPDVRGHVEEGRYEYELAGCSCLAGDVFGIYRFNEPLSVGDRVVFENAGAYSIVKAHMFNGINLPTIYTVTESGELVLTKRFTYEDFASRCGVEARVTL